MKKLVVFASLLAVVALSSCSKEWECCDNSGTYCQTVDDSSEKNSLELLGYDCEKK